MTSILPASSDFMARFGARLDHTLKRHQELTTALEATPAPAPDKLAALAQQKSQLDPIVQAISALQTNHTAQADLKELMALDPSLTETAQAELEDLKSVQAALEKDLKVLLLPKDAADQRSVIMEIRMGTGGGEAALFARDLWTMYTRFAERKGWQSQLLSLSQTDLRGVKEVVFSIKGQGVFQHLKFESGVHRIQRVPETEAGGRVHTSAATVAVLPEAEEVDVVIRDEDLRIDTYRASGAGGQHVNKTDSAVRITHLPTGVVVQQQDEKSQHKNKARALKILRSRLYDKQRQEEEAKRASSRKLQVGSGDRSQRIRTYNALQGRVTDHRINLTLHQFENILNGDLDGLVTALINHDQTERLAEIDPGA